MEMRPLCEVLSTEDWQIIYDTKISVSETCMRLGLDPTCKAAEGKDGETLGQLIARLKRVCTEGKDNVI